MKRERSHQSLMALVHLNVCRMTSMSRHFTTGKRHIAGVVFARAVGMTVMRNAGVPISEIAREYGRSHSSVIELIESHRMSVEVQRDATALSETLGLNFSFDSVVPIDLIAEVVCDLVMCPVGGLLNSSRSHRVVFARRLIVTLAREMTGASYPEIAKVISRGRSHSTLVYAFQKLQAMREAGEGVTIEGVTFSVDEWLAVARDGVNEAWSSEKGRDHA